MLIIMMTVPVFFLFIISVVSSLTCYNGLKIVRGQSVGQSVDECPSSAYCYNMTASALLLVDVVKAGCSTWRCMLARDKCISTTFQMIPVSLCCCSSDRCNVGENAIGYEEQQNNRNWGGLFSEPDRGTVQNPKQNSKSTWSKQEVEDKFKNFDVDQRTTTGDIEEAFESIDVRHTPAPNRFNKINGVNRGDRQLGRQSGNIGREIDID